MVSIRRFMLAAGLSALAIAPVLMVNAPANAVEAPAKDPEAVKGFITGLADEALGVLRDKSISEDARNQKFKEMLRNGFAVELIGDKVIRSHRRALSPEQYAAYQEAFPDFLVSTYSSRLMEYADSEVKIVRTAPKGSRGDLYVYSMVESGGSARPIEVIWEVREVNDEYKITNLVIAGVDMVNTQEADFNAYINRNGFDKLVAFMQEAKAS